MKITYNKTRALSTSELPGVICQPPLVFDFLAAPTVEQWKDLGQWVNKSEVKPKDTIQIARQFLLGVTTEDDDYYELGSVESVTQLIDQTELSFIVNVLRGFHQRVVLERIADLKKLEAPLRVLPTSGAKTGQARVY